ncbi:TetR/AcrR family transcriptional regulator [Streptomyces sp. NBC_00083]|uniref:TetR/AcrR family transcriptional regulator n=1 Tax=Streptomyces sp. NBC_00083 TaxID=2975647 RepID=UPI00224F5AB9|nr:TetR/AcrR family transcriptional regulator [Streptomyces sp. NBC_00083]MCX5387419.1 WHG domain-containing protein [Streptomyces sp. NBC_00083]
MSSEEAVPRRRRRNPRGQGQVLKTELVEAAARLLATLERPETLTLRQVAREVGVAPASIYGHFPDLGALVQHVLRLRYDELAAVMRTAADGTEGPLADLAARCAAYVHWGVDHPGPYRTLFGGGMPDELVPTNAHGAGEELLGSVVASLAGAQQDGPEHRDHRGPEQEWQAGLLLWTALHGLVALYNAHGNMPWPDLTDLIAQTLALHTGRPVAELVELARTADRPA